MPTRSFRKEKAPSSYTSILLRINENDVDENHLDQWEKIEPDEDSDFLERFENRHYLLTIFKHLERAGWLKGKEHERRIILVMTKHTKFQVLSTAVQRLTYELSIIRGVNQTELDSIQQESLMALLLSNDPIKLASSIIELKYRRRLNTVAQLQEHLKSIRPTMAVDEQLTGLPVQSQTFREDQQPNIVPTSALSCK